MFGKSKIFSKILFIPMMLIAFGLIGYLLLAGVYYLPTERMEKNMRESVHIFYAEDNYPQLMEYKNSQLDNFTDGIMLLTASNPNHENIWHAAINAERYRTSDTPVQTILDVYGDGVEDADNTYYARYWHGYLVFLKPLLLLFGYGQIREIMMFCQLGVFAILLLMLAKRSVKLIIPVFLMWIFLNPVVTMMSLQFNTVLLITFLSMIAIVWIDDKKIIKDSYAWSIFFMTIGVLTSYFDLLTYPLLTLGAPLALWLVFNFSERFRKNFLNLFQMSAFWGIGYAGMWSLKWILGSLITGENVIGDAVEQMAYRTSSVVEDAAVSISHMAHELQYSARQYTWIFALILLSVYFVFQILKLKKLNINLLISFAVISVFPAVWYLALKNHSFVHHWFTYRELSISIYAISTCMLIHGEEKK